MKDTPLAFNPQPMTAEQVMRVHEVLWEALITIPIHRHTERNTRECMHCKGRRLIVEAYRLLPVYTSDE